MVQKDIRQDDIPNFYQSFRNNERSFPHLFQSKISAIDMLLNFIGMLAFPICTLVETFQPFSSSSVKTAYPKRNKWDASKESVVRSLFGVLCSCCCFTVVTICICQVECFSSENRQIECVPLDNGRNGSTSRVLLPLPWSSIPNVIPNFWVPSITDSLVSIACESNNTYKSTGDSGPDSGSKGKYFQKVLRWDDQRNESA